MRTFIVATAMLSAIGPFATAADAAAFQNGSFETALSSLTARCHR